MAGYSLTSPSSVNTSNRNLNNKKCLRSFNHSPSSSSFSSSHFKLNHNKILTPNNTCRILKTKNRIKMNTFQMKEREAYKKILLKNVVFADNQKLNRSLNSHILGNNANSLKDVPQTNRISLMSEIKSRNLHSLSNFNQSIMTKSNNSIFIQNNKNSISISQAPTTRLANIETWKVPDKSQEFKSSVEKRFSLICPSTLNNKKHIKNCRTISSSINDNQIDEKMNLISVHIQDRQSISSKIKTVLNRFITFDFISKFKSYLPYTYQDHVLSERAKTVPTLEPPVVTWNEEMEENLCKILNDPDRLLVSDFSINIHTRDIMTLAGSNWLNDAVIEFYLNLIVLRSKEQKHLPSVYVFNTYFFPRLSNGQPIGRWANKLDFFSYDLLLVPIHHNSHWRLAVVNNEKKSIEYYDSLGFELNSCIDLLAEFLQKESLSKRKTSLDISQWRLLYRIPDLPLQMNSYDCGVFTCKYADFITRRAALTFTQKHIPLIRKCMMWEIIHKKLLG